MDWREGFSSTPVASWYSSDGENRLTFCSRRALASTSSVVGLAAGTGCTVSATNPAINPPNNVKTSQIAIAGQRGRRGPAGHAPRASIANASQSAM